MLQISNISYADRRKQAKILRESIIFPVSQAFGAKKTVNDGFSQQIEPKSSDRTKMMDFCSISENKEDF
ncbi:hypothetical protein CDO73_10300 [Saccharibacillus sp. O23]|nr:hypothetical protein CDO73_10300 [Saccharibacillus sp. O23]